MPVEGEPLPHTLPREGSPITEFVIAHEGLSENVIVLPAAAPRPMQLAAEELQRTLAILTGAWLPIETQAGGPALELALAAGEPEEHGWSVTAEQVTLWGTEPAAVLFAVYAFLEQVGGVRWLSEYEGGEVIPRRETLTAPLGEQRFRPRLRHRAFTNYPALDRRTVAMVDWMARHRCNRFMVFANVPGSLAAYDEVLRPELLARGLKLEIGHHSFRFLVPPEEHFSTHPEYFAEVKGHRVPDGQLCTSHPAVVDLVAQRLGELFDRYPELDCCGLWPNDGYGWCECAACLAQEPQQPAWPYAAHPRRTDTYLRFVNAVAERLAHSHPDRCLSALAYVNYVQPPTSVTPASNVRVCFAPFQRCFKHPLAAPPQCARPNAAYREMLRQWVTLTPAGVYLFEYLMLIDMLSVPYPLTQLIPAEVAGWQQSGVEGFVLEFKPEEWRTYGVHAQLLTALAWSPAGSPAEIMAGYEAALYGPAASEMAACRKALEQLWVAAGPCVHHYDRDYLRRATPRLLQPALEHLGRATLQVAGTELRYREAVQGARVGLQWLLRLGEWQKALAGGGAGRLGEELLQWARQQEKSGALDRQRFEQIITAASDQG